MKTEEEEPDFDPRAERPAAEPQTPKKREWDREAGVYKSWRPPNFWVERSTRL